MAGDRPDRVRPVTSILWTPPGVEALPYQYLLVDHTHREGRRTVPTPVWGVRDGDALAIWTVSDSGKGQAHPAKS